MRVRRSMLSFGTNVLFLFVTMVVALKSTPWLMYWLSRERFGGYRIVVDTSGWLGLLELGLGGAIGPLLARSIGLGDERALRETIAAGSRAYAVIAIVAVTCGFLATPFVPYLTRDLTSAADLADLRTAWVVVLGTLPVLVLLPLRSIVEAKQFGYLINLISLAQSLIITGLSLWWARKGWGITGQALAQLTGVWFTSLAMATGVLWAHPGLLRAAFTMPVSLETKRSLRGLSLPNLLLNVSGRLSVLSDNLVVGGILGAGQVTTLVNTQKLINIGQSVLQAIGGSSWAALADLHTRGDHETFNRRLVEMTRMVAVLGVVGLVPVVAYNRAFIKIWLGASEPYGGDLVTVIAAFNAILLAEQSLWAWCFSATGKIRKLVAPAMLAAGLNIAASITLTYAFGITGPLLGSTVGFLAVGSWLLPLSLKRNFGTGLRPLARAMGWPCLVGTLAGLVMRWGLGDHEPASWLGLGAEMSAAGLGMLGLAAAVLMTPEDRRLWGVRLRGLRTRREAAEEGGAR